VQDSWDQLPELLLWFTDKLLSVDPSAKLVFDAGLPKDLRADVHQ
jgi:hypothetical protein